MTAPAGEASEEAALDQLLGRDGSRVPDYEAGWIDDPRGLVEGGGGDWSVVGPLLRTLAGGHDPDVGPEGRTAMDLIVRGAPWQDPPVDRQHLARRLYEHLARAGSGEAMFRSGHPALLHQGIDTGALESVPPWSRDRFVGLGDLRHGEVDAVPGLVVDLGCGAGADCHLVVAAHPTATVVGLDRSLALLVRAPRHRRVHLLFASADRIPVITGSVDLILANGLPALLGATTMRPVLEECARALAPAGELRFTALVIGPDRPLEELSDVDVANSLRCGKPVIAAIRSALRASGLQLDAVLPNASPFVEGFGAAGVRSVTAVARRATRP